MVSELNVGTDPALKVVTPPKLVMPVKASVCPINEVVKFEIVILEVVESSSLIMKTSLGVMAVTAGSSLTLILANFLTE